MWKRLWIIGAYVHGGAFGLTRHGQDLPWVARYFNNYLAQAIEKSWPSMNCFWTAVAIQFPKHRDSLNERNTYNYVMELKTQSLEGLWVMGDVVGGTIAEDYQHEELDGNRYDGCLVVATTKPAPLDPLIPHT